MKMKVIKPDGTIKIVEDRSWQIPDGKLPRKKRKNSALPSLRQRQEQQREYKTCQIIKVLKTNGEQTLTELCLLTGISKSDLQKFIIELETNNQVERKGRFYFLTNEVD